MIVLKTITAVIVTILALIGLVATIALAKFIKALNNECYKNNDYDTDNN